MGIEIRKINHESFEEVRYYFITHEYCWKDSDPSTFVPKTESKRDEVANKFMALLSKDENKYHCLGAFDQKELVGSHFLEIYEIDNQKACHIHGLWIKQKYRNQGLAKQLKIEGEKWANLMNCDFMDANVSVSNVEMIKLNEGLGYEVARYNFRKKL